MTDQVRMRSKTVFGNERITVFREGGPAEGVKGEAALIGDEFETDLGHAKELRALGLADPLNSADLDSETPPLQAHHQVSILQLAADQAARGGEAAAEKPEAPAPEVKVPAKAKAKTTRS